MKASLTLLPLLAAAALSSCSSVAHSPVHGPAPSHAPKPRAAVRTPVAVTAKPEGALRQVPSTPPAPKPKAFPDIPLKDDTGGSPLIHDRPDTPTYKRSGS